MTNWLEGKEKRQRENRKITIKLKKQNLKNKSGNGDFPDSHDPTVFVYSISIFFVRALVVVPPTTDRALTVDERV
jgi:hypothetical protein